MVTVVGVSGERGAPWGEFAQRTKTHEFGLGSVRAVPEVEPGPYWVWAGRDRRTHESATGVDTTPDGPGKVWRCDGCGWLHRTEVDLDGYARTVTHEECA